MRRQSIADHGGGDGGLGKIGVGEYWWWPVGGGIGLAEGRADGRGAKDGHCSEATCYQGPRAMVGGGGRRGHVLAWERDKSCDNSIHK